MKFLNSKHTLFDVISSLFHYYIGEKLNQDIYAHLFNITINDIFFLGPFKSQGLFPRMQSNQQDCTAAKPVMLNTLIFRANDAFTFSHDMGSTKIKLKLIAVSVPTAEDLTMTKPVFLAGADTTASATTDSNAPLYTDEELAESRRYRDRYENTAKYRWRWNDSRQIDELVEAVLPAYTIPERLIMETLISRGMTFAAAWKQYLEPALLNHKKAGTAGKLSFQLHQSQSSYLCDLILLLTVKYSQLKRCPEFESCHHYSMKVVRSRLLSIRQDNLDTPIVGIPPKPNRPWLLPVDNDSDERPNKRARE
jgi:hypothetical protein